MKITNAKKYDDMIEAVRQYFVRSFHAIIRKGAVMSKRDARRNTMLAIASPLLFILILFIELTEPSETLFRSCLFWWLLGMMALSSIVLPMALYGYHNRHLIETENEEPPDFGPGMAGALLGTALAPIVHAIIDYFGG